MRKRVRGPVEQVEPGTVGADPEPTPTVLEERFDMVGAEAAGIISLMEEPNERLGLMVVAVEAASLQAGHRFLLQALLTG